MTWKEKLEALQASRRPKLYLPPGAVLVGEEWDGRHVPIEQLSYRPAGGWTDATMQNVEATQMLSYTRARQLALRSVFRRYRVRNAETGMVEIEEIKD
jgi:hypothetical protein